MKNKVQTGNVMDWLNSTGNTVMSGSLVIFGAMVGVAVADILDGEVGALDVEGVFELPKTAALVMTQGARAFINTTSKLLTSTTSDVPVGVVFKSAAGSDSTAQVKLNPGISA